jgi:hypothetical protein
MSYASNTPLTFGAALTSILWVGKKLFFLHACSPLLNVSANNTTTE